MSSQYGNLFRIATWGESHGKAVGVVVDGCPAGISISEEDIQRELDRRKPGQSKITTPRKEQDQVEIASGIFEGKTTGTPISLRVNNQDQKSKDYTEMMELYRPSHADYTYDAKYGFRDYRGGGRSSARESIGRVAAGALAKKWLQETYGIEVIAYVSQIGTITADIDGHQVQLEDVEANAVRCPDPIKAKEMEETILAVRKDGDSIGGVIELWIRHVPAGVGEPIFDRVEALLAKAMLSIPATKGFEVGSGFRGTTMRGSEHNDIFYSEDGTIQTKTNYSGGVQGGITNGMPIFSRIAFKPTATILKPQETVNRAGDSQTLQARGRHDPCVLPRAVVIVEAMAAITMMDLLLEYRARRDKKD
jgi:chorismate synthase